MVRVPDAMLPVNTREEPFVVPTDLFLLNVTKGSIRLGMNSSPFAGTSCIIMGAKGKILVAVLSVARIMEHVGNVDMILNWLAVVGDADADEAFLQSCMVHCQALEEGEAVWVGFGHIAIVTSLPRRNEIQKSSYLVLNTIEKLAESHGSEAVRNWVKDVTQTRFAAHKETQPWLSYKTKVDEWCA